MNDSRYASSRVNPEGSGLPPRRQVSDQLCGCGCGEHTLIASRTRGRDRVRRGEPQRFVRGHTGRRGGARPPAPLCDPDTVICCAACDTPLHQPTGGQRTCADGHPPAAARNLCRPCYDATGRAGTRADYPPVLRSRDDLMEEWEWMRPQGVGFREFPARVGMTSAAWERAFHRARKAGDPRAVRTDERGRCAA